MSKAVKKASPSILKEAAPLYKVKTAQQRSHTAILGKMKDLENTPTSNKIKSSVVKNTNTIIYWLGGNAIIPNPIRSDFDLFLAGTDGIPKSSVDKLANYLGVSRKSMAEDILDLSVKTLERKAPADKLDKRTSSHALEIAKVMQHAFEVFEDEDKIKRWINKENRALNGMRPLALFDTLTGLNMVNDILGRIEEGVYS